VGTDKAQSTIRNQYFIQSSKKVFRLFVCFLLKIAVPAFACSGAVKVKQKPRLTAKG
jgi:hypothetical protein